MSNARARLKYKKFISRAVVLVEKMKKDAVLFYRDMGAWLVEVCQDGEIRAEYGRGLLQSISNDLTEQCGSGFSVDNLYNMRRVFSTRKKLETSPKLDWSGYVELLPVKDERLRARLEKKAVKEGLAARDIRRLVKEARKDVKSRKELPPLVRPTDLKLHTYKRAESPGALDLGFSFSLPVTKKQAQSAAITDTPSYTYAATVVLVSDGDTQRVSIHLGFGARAKDKLRLRGINCPELGTPEGDRAKKYVEKVLPVGSTIVIKSNKCKTEKWGRFLADVFYFGKDSSQNTLRPRGDRQGVRAEGYLNGGPTPEDIIADGIYLNQELLDKGLAVRMEE